MIVALGMDTEASGHQRNTFLKNDGLQWVTYCYFGNISVLSDVGYFQCLFSTDLLWMMLFYYDIPERQSVSVMKYHSLEFFL
jgi:hypothetical protein